MSGEKYAGPFADMEFPPYTYKEYPKVVGTRPGGDPILVHSAEEEKAFLEAPPAEAVVPTKDTELARAQFENQQLRERLEALEKAQADAAAAKKAEASAKIEVGKAAEALKVSK